MVIQFGSVGVVTLSSKPVSGCTILWNINCDEDSNLSQNFNNDNASYIYRSRLQQCLVSLWNLNQNPFQQHQLFPTLRGLTAEHWWRHSNYSLRSASWTFPLLSFVWVLFKNNFNCILDWIREDNFSIDWVLIIILNGTIKTYSYLFYNIYWIQLCAFNFNFLHWLKLFDKLKSCDPMSAFTSLDLFAPSV